MREIRTNTPLQALDLMNDVTFLEAARKLAERMLTEGGRDARCAHRLGFALALARRAQHRARGRSLLEALRQFEARYRAIPRRRRNFSTQGESPRDRARTRELAAYTSVASMILNLDEVITKE